MNYFVKRILFLFVVFIIAISGIFVLVNNMPGDPAYGLAVSISQQRNIPLEQALKIAHRMMGIDPDESLIVRYGRFISNLFNGNFGYSSFYNASVNEIISKSLPWTLFVIALATFLSFFCRNIFRSFCGEQKRHRYRHNNFYNFKRYTVHPSIYSGNFGLISVFGKI